MNIPVKHFHISSKYLNIGINKTFFIKTYGCQDNVRDSEIISGILLKMGFTKASSFTACDFLILNTCAIRENAHQKVYGKIGDFKYHKTKNSNFRLAIVGCMIQQNHVIEKIKTTYPQVDLVFGTHNFNDIPNLVATIYNINEKQLVVKQQKFATHFDESLPSKRTHSYKAFVTIMKGCNNYCSYCVVPFTRGFQISRDFNNIMGEVHDLVKKNYKEITLVGQNVNAWGKDKPEWNLTFANLLEAVAKTNIPRLKFVTSNPWNFTNSIMQVVAKYENIMPYIHLPVQSGSDNVLTKMRRRGSRSIYLEKVKKLRKLIANLTLSTDIIVGYPNENEQDFQETLSLYKLCQFDHAYTFIYSKRENTPAATITDVISADEKRIRLAQLNKFVARYSLLNNKKHVNKIVSVLVDGYDKQTKKLLTGYSMENKLVHFNGFNKKINIGDIVNVKIIRAQEFSLIGEFFG